MTICGRRGRGQFNSSNNNTTANSTDVPDENAHTVYCLYHNKLSSHFPSKCILNLKSVKNTHGSGQGCG
ncbi:uncharacterized protein BJX67DRAFT_367305 [Aspergillus lucknowensis]|uniref:Uncharacterized protein n=1 Tax=Aspergillus lucknowensis TaxID=176173 RepID=A0ABR4L937_9EURO